MRHITLLLILVSTFIQAQKIKVKKGEVFVDDNKVALIEKEKVKGANNYLKIFDNEKKHLLNAKLVSEESSFFGSKKISNYFIIECLEQKDSIGIEKLGFYLGEKQVVKYLTSIGVLNTNGFDSAKINTVLSETKSKPSFAEEKFQEDLNFIKNVNYVVDRDTSNPIFIEEIKTGTAYSVINNLSITQTKYNIFQGKDLANKVLIGYAYIEKPEIGSVNLIIANSKDTPLGYFDGFKYYTFYPLTKLDVELFKGNPTESIKYFSKVLIENNKL
ncbi:hypothetical protein [Hyunsoonleella pacifica]|uniref:Uncharacterized protein n=1 Tax=Hyunsoonleella pacifica TaxID=1080224 RepID=A0A4Q9FKI4_9FLAO|nr:hypothetical protein [Hyunsoonleella pacifica]TBN13885.1 hypothetical protein EYD46_15445 [Hyunsoonleella pacifica]GGD26507.1 hypothetical protein GCM10011368_30650 [Hyunsoonleella pacifica]